MIDHSKCTHTRDRAGRAACRAGKVAPEVIRHAVQEGEILLDAIRTSERLAITQTAILAAVDRVFPNPAAMRGLIRRLPIRVLLEIAEEIDRNNADLSTIALHNLTAIEAYDRFAHKN